MNVIVFWLACKLSSYSTRSRHARSRQNNRASIRHFRQMSWAAYGDDPIRPKYHYILHLPDMLQRHGSVFSCLVNERRHRLVKQYTRTRSAPSRWELGALEEIVTCQMYEAENVVFGRTGLIKGHAPRGQTRENLEAMCPEASVIQVGTDVRTFFGTAHIHDIVWVQCGETMYAAKILVLCLIDDVNAAIVDRYELSGVGSDDAWPVFTFGDQNACLVSSDDLLCATQSQASDTARSVFRPFYLR